jgi:hypothetical protein
MESKDSLSSSFLMYERTYMAVYDEKQSTVDSFTISRSGHATV